MENFKIADFTLDFFRLEKSSRDFQRFWHIRKVKPNFSRYLPSRSESLVVLRCFLETAKSFFPRFGTAFALYVGRDQKDPGLFEKIEVHFPVSTVLVKWYLPEKFIPQIISGMECCMRFQQTQGTENSRRCRIRYSPCRLL